MAPFITKEKHNFTFILEDILDEKNKINALRSKCSMNSKETPLIKTSDEFVYTYIVPNLSEKMYNNYNIKNGSEETCVWYRQDAMDYCIQLIFEAL